MNADKIRTCVLFDIYGELLSPSVADAVDLYYNDDLSLSEAAENTGISRQGIRDSIVRGVELLESYESKLRLYDKYKSNEETLARIRSEIRGCGIPQDAQDRILSLLDTLSI